MSKCRHNAREPHDYQQHTSDRQQPEIFFDRSRTSAIFPISFPEQVGSPVAKLTGKHCGCEHDAITYDTLQLQQRHLRFPTELVVGDDARSSVERPSLQRGDTSVTTASCRTAK